MGIIDSKGRLFGKINLLDLGAIAVIILVLIGIFVVPGPRSIAQVGGSATEEIEVYLIVRGLNLRQPQEFIKSIENTSVNVIIRNEPAGSLKIESVEELPNFLAVTQPDGSVKPLLDPRPIVSFSTDMILYMTASGVTTNDGVVIANQKVKIGTVFELDGSNYNFRGSVIDIHKKEA